MVLTENQRAVFEENQNMRDEVFKLLQDNINSIFEYLRIVDDFDYSGTIDEVLSKENAHLKSLILHLTKGKQP